MKGVVKFHKHPRLHFAFTILVFIAQSKHSSFTALWTSYEVLYFMFFLLFNVASLRLGEYEMLPSKQKKKKKKDMIPAKNKTVRYSEFLYLYKQRIL